MKNAFFFRPFAFPFTDVDQACPVSWFLDREGKRGNREKGVVKIYLFILESVYQFISRMYILLLNLYIIKSVY